MTKRSEVLSFNSGCCGSVSLSGGGSFPKKALANFSELDCFLALGGGSVEWNAAPKIRGRFFEL